MSLRTATSARHSTASTTHYLVLALSATRTGAATSVQGLRRFGDDSSGKDRYNVDDAQRIRNTRGQGGDRSAAPSVPILTTAGHLLKGRLSQQEEQPDKILRDLLSKCQATTEFVRLCLQEHRDRLDKLERVRSIELVRGGKIGGLTLSWLWNDDARYSYVLRADTQFLVLLSYFVVTEGLGSYCVEWLKQDMPVPYRGSVCDTQAWRGTLLRQIVKAHLTLDLKGCAEPALQLYADMRDQIVRARKEFPGSHHRGRRMPTGLARTSLWPATVELLDALRTGTFPNTTPDLYDTFVSWLSTERRIGDPEYYIASMLLFHPSGSQPDHMLKLLRDRLSNKSGVALRDALSGVSARTLLQMNERTSQVLKLQNRAQDAEWVTQLSNQILPMIAGARSNAVEVMRMKGIADERISHLTKWRKQQGLIVSPPVLKPSEPPATSGHVEGSPHAPMPPAPMPPAPMPPKDMGENTSQSFRIRCVVSS